MRCRLAPIVESATFIPIEVERSVGRDGAGDHDRVATRRDGGEGWLAVGRGGRLRDLVARVAAVIRIDAVWLAVEPLDMRAGTETALARVVRVFGEARAHHAYLFANRRANRIKVLVHDGIGIWLCARRLHQGRFIWASAGIGLAADDHHRAVAGAGDRIAMVSHRRTGDDSRGVKICCCRANRCGTIERMQMHDQLTRMDAQQLREFAAELIETLASKDRELRHKQLKIEQLTP